MRTPNFFSRRVDNQTLVSSHSENEAWREAILRRLRCTPQERSFALRSGTLDVFFCPRNHISWRDAMTALAWNGNVRESSHSPRRFTQLRSLADFTPETVIDVWKRYKSHRLSGHGEQRLRFVLQEHLRSALFTGLEFDTTANVKIAGLHGSSETIWNIIAPSIAAGTPLSERQICLISARLSALWQTFGLSGSELGDRLSRCNLALTRFIRHTGLY